MKEDDSNELQPKS